MRKWIVLTSLQRQQHPHRFLVLDAIRGLAALAVLLYHVAPVLGADPLPHAYLAVDFFFLLSGFVLSFAYQQRLDSGWPTLSFLKVRLIRLYPLYALSILFSLAWFAAEHFHPDPHAEPYNLKVDLLLAIFLLPHIRPQFTIFPLNNPAWSLFGEWLANIVHALFLRRLSDFRLALIAAVVAVVHISIALTHGSGNFGFAGRGVFALIPRVLASYLLGMLLARWWQKHPKPQTLWGWPAFLALLGIFAGRPSMALLPWFDTAIIYIGFPAVLLYAARAAAGNIMRPVYHLAGVASYAIYILHNPMYHLLRIFLPLNLYPQMHPSQVAWTLLFVTLVVTLSLLADRFYDIPLRKYLRARLGD